MEQEAASSVWGPAHYPNRFASPSTLENPHTTSILELDRLFAVYSNPEVSQVYLLFLGKLKHTDFTPNFETREARLFAPEEIPWDRLAFTSVGFALRHFVESGTEGAQSAWIGSSENY